jgi:hypothetical protein
MQLCRAVFTVSCTLIVSERVILFLYSLDYFRPLVVLFFVLS